MRMFLLGFLACYIIASLFYLLDDEADTNLMAVFVTLWVAVWFVISLSTIGNGWTVDVIAHILRSIPEEDR